MKNIFKYTIVFCITLLILFLLLVITAKIPRSAIQENIKESTSAFGTRFEIKELVKRRDYTFTHPYADAMLLNIMLCVDSESPITSVLEAKYYYPREYERQIEYNFDEMVKNNVEGKIEYLRYWHGQMSILRPLLVFLNLSQIYIINNIVFWSLIILLTIILIKKKYIKLLISFLIGLIMCAAPIIPLCLEYSITFHIMLITTILVIYMEDRNKNLGILFFIVGIITNYFDFLTTEIITLFVPLIFMLEIRYKENRLKGFKDTIILVAKLSSLWLLGYCMMWISKWIVSSIVLNINAMNFVKDHILERTSGRVPYMTSQPLGIRAMVRNLFTLYPLNIQKDISKLTFIPIIIVVFEIIFIKKKNVKKELWFSLVLLLISIVPYIRYGIIANHSYKHYFFTFRSQVITIMSLILSISHSVDKNLLLKEIRVDKMRIKNK